MRKIEVKEFSKKWATDFQQESKSLNDIFKEEIVEIHHIGSTSIEGLSAKPIIDIMPIVRDIQRVDVYNEQMIQLGYTPKGENGLPGRRYFQKGGDNRTHHVHIYEQGNPEIMRHLVFRDYLKSHPVVAKKYGELKSMLAKKFPYDVESYIAGKDKFVQAVEEKAKRWNNRNQLNFHRAIGVYGICVHENKLLVIQKNGGPYINRYDLPGGNLEAGESLEEGVQREFLEETGLLVDVLEHVATADFMIHTNWREGTAVHHVAIFYLVEQIGGAICKPLPFEGQDSLGAVWITEGEATKKNSSPLVLKAFEWLSTNTVSVEATYYENWEVKKISFVKVNG